MKYPKLPNSEHSKISYVAIYESFVFGSFTGGYYISKFRGHGDARNVIGCIATCRKGNYFFIKKLKDD